jgi:hypothetical protein
VVIEPPGAAVPPDLIAAFTDALAGAEEIQTVGRGEADTGAYGLDESAARVEIFADRAEPVVVTIGSTNPTGTAVYARQGGTPEIVLIGRNVRYYEDLLLQALPVAPVPEVDEGRPVGG